MKLSSLLVLLPACLLLHTTVLGQYKTTTYSLQGVVNRDTGTVSLLPVGGLDYDPNFKNQYQAKISQGHFVFNGKMAYPGSYLIRIGQDYVSSDFIIEPGTQTINCNADSLRETPKLITKTMVEYRFFARTCVQPIAQEREQAFDRYLAQKSVITAQDVLDSLQASFERNRASLIHQQQLLYLNYASQHPHSYVALWQLVKNMQDGYQPVFDSIYAAFATSLKNTPTGKTIAQRLKSSKATAIGQIFPSLRVMDMGSKPVSVAAGRPSKYTLVDFWFSHCGPCLREFPKLKELYATYQAKGFTIIGISTDKPADAETWKKTVQEKGLVWPQYLDPSGKLTISQLSIGYFPSNFLLDENGTIIGKNISPSDLSNFLRKKM